MLSGQLAHPLGLPNSTHDAVNRTGIRPAPDIWPYTMPQLLCRICEEMVSADLMQKHSRTCMVDVVASYVQGCLLRFVY